MFFMVNTIFFNYFNSFTTLLSSFQQQQRVSIMNKNEILVAELGNECEMWKWKIMTNGRQQQQHESSKEGKSDFVNEYEIFIYFWFIFRPWKPYKSGRKIKIEEERICLMWHSANVYDFVWCVCVWNWEFALCTLCRLSVLKVFSFVKWLFTCFTTPHQPKIWIWDITTTCLGCLHFLSHACLASRWAPVQRKFSADSWMLMNVR